MESDSVVILAIIDAVLVGMFFLFRVLPWSRPGPWRLIWITATLAFLLFSLGEASAMTRGGSAISFDVQAPLFGAILATTTCLILVYVHGVRISDEALTLALVDELTQLPNSRAFSSRLEAALRASDPFSVAYIHLQGLGAVNDLFGAHRGDILLTGLAGILRGHAGRGDFIGRLGGDTFGMLIAGPPGRASDLTQVVQASLRDMANREADTIHVVISVGIVPRTEASDPGRLIRLAYRAMQHAERAGVTGVVEDAPPR
jgi:diguanylate cyclase (GGDEF)-like protein